MGWELEFTPYAEWRMEERAVTEVEVRLMLQEASGLRPDAEPGRWAAECRRSGATWNVIVEPDPATQRLVVVTVSTKSSPYDRAVMTRHLEISFRRGKPLAAYLYLRPRPLGGKATSREHGRGLVVDYGPDGAPVGVEITAPTIVTIEEINRVLAEIGEPPATEEDLRPLRAA